MSTESNNTSSDSTMTENSNGSTISRTEPIACTLDREQIDSIGEVDTDGTFLKGMVDSFCKRCPQLLAKMEAALANNDATAVASTGHEIRGMSGILGATDMMKAAAALESKGKAADFTDAAMLLTSLRDHAAQAQIALRLHSDSVIAAAAKNKT